MSSSESSPPKLQNLAGRKQRSQLVSKHNTELKNPCMKEEELSYRCLDENNSDRDSCLTVFKNYKTCREFWSLVKNDRKKKGIKPELPLPEHRQQIKEEYLQTGAFKLRSPTELSCIII